jgi:membrane protein YdbS with pleckstrin-like domain
MPTLTQQGIDAFKRGEKSVARELLRRATVQNPENVQAWLWLSGAAEDDQERIEYLQRALEIDPGNIAAAKGLAKLIANGVAQVQIKNSETTTQSNRKTNNLPPQKQKKIKERILFKAKPSVIPFVIVFLFVIFLAISTVWVVIKVFGSSAMSWFLGFSLVILFGALIWKIGIAFLKSLFARYTLTTKHLIVKTGVLSRSQKTIPIDRIQDVSFQQVFLLRPFGVGNVIVESAGERGEIRLQALADSRMRARQILHVVDKFG